MRFAMKHIFLILCTLSFHHSFCFSSTSNCKKFFINKKEINIDFKNQRAGMTSNLKERKAYWKKRHPHLKNWKVVENSLTYQEAQTIENQYKKKGYTAHPGGRKKKGRVYSVYTFEY